MDMELEFPGDRRERSVRGGTNISEVERWVSVAAGAAMAVYGLSRRRPAGLALAVFGGLLVRRGAVGRCEIYKALDLDTTATSDDTRQALGGDSGTRVQEAVTVQRSRAELYEFWRNVENLPRFMQHLQSVERLSDTQSRWRASGPGGVTVEWDAEIINDVPNELIAWRSLEGADVVSAGSVHFEDAGGLGTRIRVRMQYSPPGGKIGATLARMLGQDPESEIRDDLTRFKELFESGQPAPPEELAFSE